MSFYDFVLDRIHDLGAAWGEEIVGVRIGHPGQRDEVYERIRSEQRVRLDQQGVEDYEDLSKKRGGSRNHDLRETRALIHHFGLSPADLPAIVFRTLYRAPRPAILRIRSEWLRDAESRRMLSHSLQSGLAPVKILRLVKAGPASGAELVRRMQRLLDNLHEDIRREMAGQPRERAETYSLEDALENHRLVLDRRTKRAFLDRRELRLTPQQFGILSVLAEAIGSGRDLVPRKELSREVWGTELVTPFALDSAVHRLRDALRPNGVSVETRRGIGHALVLPSSDTLLL